MILRAWWGQEPADLGKEVDELRQDALRRWSVRIRGWIGRV
jgi:hypothetical protein